MKTEIRKLIVWVDYDKKDKTILESIYFKRPTTKHTSQDVVSKKAKLEIEI